MSRQLLSFLLVSIGITILVAYITIQNELYFWLAAVFLLSGACLADFKPKKDVNVLLGEQNG